MYELFKYWDEGSDIGFVICSRLTFRRLRKFKVGTSRESFTLLENRGSFKKQNAVFCITVCITFYYAFCNVIVVTNSVGFGVSHWFTLKIILFGL